MEEHWYISRNWSQCLSHMGDQAWCRTRCMCAIPWFLRCFMEGDDARLDVIRKSHGDWRACAPTQWSSLAELSSLSMSWVSESWSSNTGCEPTLQSEYLSSKTLHKTTKLIPDEPWKCSSAFSELIPCLAMDFSGVWNWTKKSNYRLDWLWINSPALRQISRADFLSIFVCQATMGCSFLPFVFFHTEILDLHYQVKYI